MKMLRLLVIGGLMATGLAAQEADLSAVTTALDKKMFDAYNSCDLETLRSMLAVDDLEMFHDHAGYLTSADNFLTAIEQNICGKAVRSVDAETLRAAAIPGFGAVQTGVHRFRPLGKDGNPAAGDGIPARFLHIWKKVGDEWKLARAVSYPY